MKSDNLFRQTPLRGLVLVSLIISTILMGGILGAGFGPIDDHEYIRQLSGDTSFNTIPKRLMETTEVGSFGQAKRYRPIYFLVRLMEVSLFQDHGSAYYAFRFFQFTAFVFFLLWGLSYFLETWVSIVLLLILFHYNSWGDIWCRLGPSEPLAAVFLSVYFVSVVSIFKSREPSKNTALATAISYAMAFGCIGSKENFIVLYPLTLLVGFCSFERGFIRLKNFIFSTLLFSTSLVVPLSLYFAFKASPQDIYVNTTDVGSRLDMVHKILTTKSPFFFVSYVCLILSLGMALWKKRNDKKLLLSVTGIFSVALLWILWEAVFYFPHYPRGNRYDFPGILLFLVSMTLFMITFMSCFGNNRRIYFLPVFLFVLCLLKLGPPPIFLTAQKTRIQTQLFLSDLEDIVTTARANPTYPIILSANKPFDIEPTTTFYSWAVWKKIPNPLYIQFKLDPQYEIKTDLERTLIRIMESSSHGGNPEYGDSSKIDPKILEQGSCISIRQSAPPVENCIPKELRFEL